ncbi:transketolase family protein [Azotosporobacter soli]|uniref:transketolase family protein n=1 Tax=Azotosporobacter soli TaxID=3055040 RepID=UPI0031FE5659
MMRNTFIKTLIEQARVDDSIFVITPDLGFSVLETFREEFPSRFLNVGIAEQNAIGVAAGLALSGYKVYVYSIIPFITMRCYEQIRLEAAYMNTNIRLVGVGAGFSYGAQGATHHALEDIAIMRVLPNMTVCCPGDPIEVEALTKESFHHQGPMFIRLAKNGEVNIHEADTEITLGKAISVTHGEDLALITTSNMLEQGRQWVCEWSAKGINAELISMHTIKPLDIEKINTLIRAGKPIITLEEHSIIGGLGSAVAEVIAESGCGIKFKRVAVPDRYSHTVGHQQRLRKHFEIEKVNLKDVGIRWEVENNEK